MDVKRESMRARVGSYQDRNDGFCRSYFSDSKRKRSRHTKQGKIVRIKPPWKRERSGS